MKNRRNMLYLHGLQLEIQKVPISYEKRTILEEYGTVLAPEMISKTILIVLNGWRTNTKKSLLKLLLVPAWVAL